MSTPAQQVDDAIASDDVVVFMKGTREAPHCGFSAQMVEILNHLLPNYSTFDVRDDVELRRVVKERSGWPTFPQLYVRGEFIGGSDIVKELFVSGDLAGRLGVAPAELPSPELHFSQRALEQLVRLAAGQPVRIELDARGDSHLSVSQRQSSDIELSVGDIVVVMDVLTATRADGLRVDYLPEPGGFIVSHAKVTPITAARFTEMLAMQEPLLVVDCRTLAEYSTGSVPGAEHLNQALLEHLAGANEERTVVFVCRNGSRSSNVAEHFAVLNGTPARYLEGGLERWRSTGAPGD